MLKTFFLLATLCLFQFFSYAQSNETINNESVVQLTELGLSKEVIIKKIQTSTCSFDLSVESLGKLKKAKVDNDVIKEMMNYSGPKTTPSNPGEPGVDMAKLVSLRPGIYYLDSATNEYNEFLPSLLTNQKAGGIDETIKRSLSGLFNSKNRITIGGTEANVKFYTKTPTFLFVFDTTASSFGNNNSIWSTVQSPNEFFIIKFNVVKGAREVVVGKSNNISSDYGIADNLKVPFGQKKLKRGIYEVTPKTAMFTGEYCIMFAASSVTMGQTHKVFDFSVR